MKTISAVVVFALVAAASAQEPASAPLSESREQLKSLRKDQAARKSGATDAADFRDALPSITAPVVGSPPPFELPSAAKKDAAEQERAKAARNWLLDRYDRLDPKRAEADRRSGANEEDEFEEKPLDPEDPEYFLKLYERQRQEAAEKEMHRAELSGAPGSTMNAAANPFTPFMSDWLAGSPVGDIVRESLEMSGARADGEVGTTSNSLSLSNPLANEASVTHRLPDSVSAMANPARVNPYLDALTLPDLGTSEISTAVQPLPPALARPPEPRHETVAPALPRPTRQDDLRRALPPGTDDAKKYFPQLKKF